MTISYVLSDFAPEEKETIDKAIPQACEAVVALLAEGITEAMNKYN